MFHCRLQLQDIRYNDLTDIISILVAAMVEAHPAHEACFVWLKRVSGGIDKGFVASHSLAELYAVLTTLPVYPPISPRVANQLIQHNIIQI